MDRIQHTLKQLQDSHMVMKQQYEDEIVILRLKLDSHPNLQGDPDVRGGVRNVREKGHHNVEGVGISLVSDAHILLIKVLKTFDQRPVCGVFEARGRVFPRI